MESSSADKVTKKRTPRKRVSTVVKETKSPKKSVSKKTPRKRAVRKASSNKTVEKKDVTKKVEPEKKESLFTPEVEERISKMNVARKAPTPFVAQKEVGSRRKKQILIVVAVLLVGVGASAGVGFTDVGQIDVDKTIEARNERIRTNTATEEDTLVSQVVVPVQDSAKAKTGGGLVGRGVGSAPAPAKPKIPVATSTATSSLQTASSTTAVASTTDPFSLEGSDNADEDVVGKEESDVIEEGEEVSSTTSSTI